jgi:hypothetical protein
MKKAFSLLFVSAIFFSLLTGCNSSSITSTSGGSGGGNQTATTVPVSLTMTDDPPSGVSVLFFQVSLTAASLTPASGSAVSLVTTPIQVDVTQLQALSAFLGTANVPVGTYNSLSLTFANPQLVILNTSDQSIASTCAIGSVCQLTPTLDNSATVVLSSSPFPVTIAAGSPLGFLIDFHLNTIIQSDLSVNLQAANGVTIGQVPPSAPSQPPPFGSLTGTVENVSASANQFTLQTPWGKTFTIDTNSSTTFTDFPPLTCETVSCQCNPGSFICLLAGQIVRVQVSSVETDGDLLAAQVTYIQASSQQTVVGTIVGIPPLPLPTGETIINLILHQNPTASTGLPVGGIASVAVWAPGIAGETATTYSIDADGFTIPSGYGFTSSSDLAVGQTVQVTVASGSVQTSSATTSDSGWGTPPHISFTASNLQLEPSQLTGSVSALGSSGFMLEYMSSPCWFGTVNCNIVALVPANVVATSQTTYQGFTPDDLSGVAVNDVVSVNGWFFPQNGEVNVILPPTIVAQTVALHSGGWF